MSITQFTIEEVRCFAGKQTLEIRPLTFLVGENSTGKTTALACFHVLANFFRGRGIDFNEKPSNPHPYSMGTFRDIVRNSKNKEKVFKLGFTSEYANNNIEWSVEFVEKKGRTEPNVSLAGIKLPNGEIVFEFEDNSEIPIRLKSFNKERNNYEILCDSNIISRFSLWEILGNIPNLPIKAFEGKYEGTIALEGAIALTEYLKTLADPIEIMADPWDLWYNFSFLSTAPIRSRPERTYDPMREFNDPEGSDIPMLLMRLEATQKMKWEKLKQQLIDFGISSGLFQDIKIKNFGRAPGGPFQLQFKVRGPTSNIIDVGYGISQVLPVLVQILYHGIRKGTEPEYKGISYFLLQQPEVHLHPRAQAELSSLLANLASQRKRFFIIETHSDYMIDRARIEIRKGTIKPEDVSLIYFEPKGNIVNVHNIGFDKIANMMGVPPHYGKFFLKETNRLMGFEE